MTIEKRQHPRAPCAIAASVEGPRGSMRGTCTNLSLGGAFVEGVHLSMGASTRLKLTLPQAQAGALVLDAQVKRVSSSPRGVAVEFTRLDPQSVQVLMKAVASLG